MLFKRWTLAVAVGGSVMLSACASQDTKLVKIYEGGVFEETADLGSNRSDCRGIAASLNEVKTDKAQFVCVEVSR